MDQTVDKSMQDFIDRKEDSEKDCARRRVPEANRREATAFRPEMTREGVSFIPSHKPQELFEVLKTCRRAVEKTFSTALIHR